MMSSVPPPKSTTELRRDVFEALGKVAAEFEAGDGQIYALRVAIARLDDRLYEKEMELHHARGR